MTHCMQCIVTSGDLRPDSLFFTAKSRRSSLPVRHGRNRFLKPNLRRQQKSGNVKTIKQGMGWETEEGFRRTCTKQLGSSFGHQTKWCQGEMCVRWSFRIRIWSSKPCQPSVIETYIYSKFWELCERLWTGGALCDKRNYKYSDWLGFLVDGVVSSLSSFRYG